MLKLGDQIAYVPLHAEGDLNHPDVEYGFITGFNSQGDPFCRYWRRGEEGKTLRTTSCSESTPKDSVVISWTVSQSVVNDWLKHYGYL